MTYVYIYMNMLVMSRYVLNDCALFSNKTEMVYMLILDFFNLKHDVLLVVTNMFKLQLN